MLHNIVEENGYYKAAQALYNLNETGILNDELFKEVLSELFSMFLHEHAGDPVCVEKFQKYLNNLSRGL